MFSVKIVEYSGHESVVSAERTAFNPRQLAPAQSTGKPTEYIAAALIAYPKSDPAITFTEGRVYVMNEEGKTVARYDLDNLNEIERSSPTNRDETSTASRYKGG